MEGRKMKAAHRPNTGTNIAGHRKSGGSPMLRNRASENALLMITTVVALCCPAVQRAAGATIYVNPGGGIQATIDSASNDDEIEVAPGVYYEAIDFGGKAVRLYSSGGPNDTIIDASGLGLSVVTCSSGEDANTILDGFTITGGGPPFYGGGMYNSGSSPTVTNCMFSYNTAYEGGGMYNTSSNPTVTNCIFTNNSATYYGGGMVNDNSSPTVANCIFSGNHVSSGSPYYDFYSGGGMYNYSSDARVTNCTFVATQPAGTAAGCTATTAA
jgi:hypothetical protein